VEELEEEPLEPVPFELEPPLPPFDPKPPLPFDPEPPLLPLELEPPVPPFEPEPLEPEPPSLPENSSSRRQKAASPASVGALRAMVALESPFR